MRRTLTCPRCSGGRIWNIRTVRERGRHNLPQDMAVAYDYNRHQRPTPSHGHYETLLCAACGYAAWYAHDFQPGDNANVSGPRRHDEPCSDCAGEDFWFVARVEERDDHGEPTELRILRLGLLQGDRAVGGFTTRVCVGCGLTVWRALALDEVLAEGRTEHVKRDSPCETCGAHARHRVEEAREIGDAYVTKMHVSFRTGLLYNKAIGELAIEICAGCSRTDWYARGLDDLRHQPRHGVVLLERSEVPPGSPYR